MILFTKKPSLPAVLILGAGKRAAGIYSEVVARKSSIQCTVRGFIPLEEKDSGIPENLIVESKDALLELAGTLNVSEIVVVQDHPTQQYPIQELLNCKVAGIKLSDWDSFLSKMQDESSFPAGKLRAVA